MDYDLDNVPGPFSVTVLVCDSFLSLSLLILDAWVTKIAALHCQWSVERNRLLSTLEGS